MSAPETTGLETWTNKLFFGTHEGRWLGYGKHTHQDGMLCTIAQTGAGKTTTSLITACLTFAGSMFIIDPKGELYRDTHARRSSMGQAIHCLDPFGVTDAESAKFNPLDELEDGSMSAITEAARLADTLIERPQNAGENKHFYDEAVALLRAVILHVKSYATYRDICNLGTVNNALASIDDLLAEMSLNPSYNGLIKRTAIRFEKKGDREKSSCVSTAQSNLTEIFEDPRVNECLSSSTFDFASLKTSNIGEGKGTTIYLVIPEHYLAPYSRLLRLIVNSALEAMYKTKDTRDPTRFKPNTPVLFLLEEFAHLGKLEALESGMGIARGSDVRLWIVLQNLSQIERNYGKHAVQTFMANTGALEAFGINDNETADYLSKKIGYHVMKREAQTIAKGDSTSQTITGKTEGESSTSTTAETHNVELIYQLNELTQGKEGEFNAETDKMIFVSGRPPIIVRKQPYYEIEGLKSLI